MPGAHCTQPTTTVHSARAVHFLKDVNYIQTGWLSLFFSDPIENTTEKAALSDIARDIDSKTSRTRDKRQDKITFVRNTFIPVSSQLKF
mmetsp:Transcript_49767/g.98354  ORF Transcript_49767/g.98354 Transcript_49767/m.98354 type:complete len:89 (+) Transcript_49767:701-967(+)